MQGFDVNEVNIPVIGGHSGVTILPLLSQVKGKKHHSTQFSSFIKECTKAKFKISNFLSASLNANELKQRPLLICNWVWHMKILKYLNCYELDTDFDRSLNLLRFYLSLFMRGKNWINETALSQLQTSPEFPFVMSVMISYS